MNNNSFLDFFKKHRILANILIITAVNLVLLTVAYLSLGPYTHHNEYQIVPVLKGMSVEEVSTLLASKNLKYEVTDSIFDNTSKPGCIIMQTPKGGSKIKDGRTIYLTIRSYSTKKVKVPYVNDLSMRQGMAALHSAGLTNISIEHKPSEYSDLILELKMNGLPLQKGDLIPVNSKVTIVVGDGSLQLADSTILNDYNENIDALEFDESTLE